MGAGESLVPFQQAGAGTLNTLVLALLRHDLGDQRSWIGAPLFLRFSVGALEWVNFLQFPWSNRAPAHIFS